MLNPKDFGSKLIFLLKKFCLKEKLVYNDAGFEKILGQKIVGPKYLGQNFFHVQKN